MVYRQQAESPIRNRMMIQLQRHRTALKRMNLPPPIPPRKVGWQIYEWARSRAEERLTSSILLSSFNSLVSWRDLLSRKLQNWDQLEDFVPSRFVNQLPQSKPYLQTLCPSCSSTEDTSSSPQQGAQKRTTRECEWGNLLRSKNTWDFPPQQIGSIKLNNLTSMLHPTRNFKMQGVACL